MKYDTNRTLEVFRDSVGGSGLQNMGLLQPQCQPSDLTRMI